jgi:ferritin-like metal-binding protein YciE
MKSITSDSTENGTQIKGKVNLEKKKSDAIKGLHKLFVNELKEIYWAEEEIKKGLNKMIKHASVYELTDELTIYHDVIKEHQTLIEEVFLLIDEKVEKVKCKPMEILLGEVEILLEETKKGIVRDAEIISSVVKIELYQIATYNVVCFFVRTMGEHDAATLLHKILDQKNENFEKLSQIIDSIELERDDVENQKMDRVYRS